MFTHEANPIELAQRSFSRILLVKPSSLGDVIHALPVLNGLRHRYPSARIDWLIASPFAPLIAGHPAVSNLILFDRHRFGRMAGRPWIIAEFVRFLAELRRTHYELVLDLQGLFRSGFLTRMTGAPCRIGFRHAREGARFAYTHFLPELPANAHAVDRNYSVAQLLGFADLPVEFPLPLPPEARRAADRFLQFAAYNAALPHDAIAISRISPRANDQERTPSARPDQPLAMSPPLVLIAPGARWETKLWLEERFVEVMDALTERGLRCVLVGSGNETSRCRAIASRCRLEPLNLAGRTTLPELAALVDRADLVLCHDSAVLHLAVALDRPVVCITGPTNPARTGPYRGGTVVRRSLDCSPCYFRRLTQCPHHHRCMSELTADQVLATISEVMTGPAERTPAMVSAPGSDRRDG